ncbi:hypothetical protein Pint_26789 [Pistacia integerrima]|uniref:Uncharacterized protein n=1 Tax=Pistacia integerrima TaxID=434235 RepID=A0ACC0YTC5_9ROSI|nr:hypothetical protein Pint_26789 [Pistacia integerrima]
MLRRGMRMLVGFAQKGFVNEVLRIFYEMRFAGIKGDAVTAMGLTQSVLEAKNLNLLKAVHSIGIQTGMDADIEVATTWISAYAKCSDLNFAELVFYGIEQGLQTVVSWNSMIAGYANNGKVFDAVRFYKWMMLDGFRPDVSTIVSLLSACAQLVALLHGMNVSKVSGSFQAGMFFMPGCTDDECSKLCKSNLGQVDFSHCIDSDNCHCHLNM